LVNRTDARRHRCEQQEFHAAAVEECRASHRHRGNGDDCVSSPLASPPLALRAYRDAHARSSSSPTASPAESDKGRHRSECSACHWGRRRSDAHNGDTEPGRALHSSPPSRHEWKPFSCMIQNSNSGQCSTILFCNCSSICAYFHFFYTNP
jgi:hypothetical protein